MSILLGELATTISEALIDANVPYELTIPRTEQEPPPPDWPTWEEWTGEEITTLHKMQGFVETYSELLIAAGAVQADDVKIVVLKPTIPAEITIELTDIVQAQGKSYTILGISEDPAGATVELRARA